MTPTARKDQTGLPENTDATMMAASKAAQPKLWVAEFLMRALCPNML